QCRRARQAGRGQGPRRRRHHPDADLPRRPPLTRARRLAVVAVLAANAALTAGCGADAVRVEPPTPDEATVALCERLETSLPAPPDDPHPRPAAPGSPPPAAGG